MSQHTRTSQERPVTQPPTCATINTAHLTRDQTNLKRDQHVTKCNDDSKEACDDATDQRHQEQVEAYNRDHNDSTVHNQPLLSDTMDNNKDSTFPPTEVVTLDEFENSKVYNPDIDQEIQERYVVDFEVCVVCFLLETVVK